MYFERVTWAACSTAAFMLFFPEDGSGDACWWPWAILRIHQW